MVKVFRSKMIVIGSLGGTEPTSTSSVEVFKKLAQGKIQSRLVMAPISES